MLHFGYVEVVMKAAPGVGIISSIVLQSDNLDEVDWEWIGGVDSRVQQNYFGKVCEQHNLHLLFKKLTLVRATLPPTIA